VATHANALRPMNVSFPSPKVLVPVQRMDSRLRGNDGPRSNACPKMTGHGDSSSYCRPPRSGDLLVDAELDSRFRGNDIGGMAQPRIVGRLRYTGCTELTTRDVRTIMRRSSMVHLLPQLPWAKEALAPVISAETIEYHHGKHHQAYVTNLNKLLEHTTLEEEALEKVIRAAPMGSIFNNAAQVWNHTFYWHCMKPGGGGGPEGTLADLLTPPSSRWQHSARSSRRPRSPRSAQAGCGRRSVDQVTASAFASAHSMQHRRCWRANPLRGRHWPACRSSGASATQVLHCI